MQYFLKGILVYTIAKVPSTQRLNICHNYDTFFAYSEA